MTAFGYGGSSMLPAVLEELRPSGGEIVQHKLGNGPWVHVRFSDWRQQQQALAKNGKVVHGFMLGVIEGVHPSAPAAGLDKHQTTVAAIPLRLQQHRHVAPSLRAPTLGSTALVKAGWWTLLCEYVFGW